MNKTFIKITNKDLYDKLVCIEKKQIEVIKNQAVMTEHQKASNGKIKLHTKMIFGLAGMLITLVGWLITKL